MLFNLVFANNTILSSFFFFFLIIDLCLLIPAVIKQIFNLIAELIIPTVIPTKEAKAEMETHPATVETKISKYLKLLMLLTHHFISVHFFNEIISCLKTIKVRNRR